MKKKSIVYVKEPTFLSPIDLQFRMMNDKIEVRGIRPISDNTITSFNRGSNDREIAYTLKRKK